MVMQGWSLRSVRFVRADLVRRVTSAHGICTPSARYVGRVTSAHGICTPSARYSTDIQPIKLTKNISLCETSDRSFDQAQRPLVLLYGWLSAKAKHIDKYQLYYMHKGFDVAHIKVTYDEILQPKKAQRIAADVIAFVGDHNPRGPVLPHCFSVGCYMYSEAVVQLLANPDKHGDIIERICAQVYDSPVDLDVIPAGMANAVTSNWLLNRTIRFTAGSYLWVSSPWVTKHYLKASKAFKHNELKAPTLFLYSDADVVCFPQKVESIMGDFRKWNIPVWGKRWNDSKHVSHYHHNPDEYIVLLDNVLKAVKLS